MSSGIRKTTEEFVKQAIAKHGDTYDYSQAVYKNDSTPIKVICKKHGLWEPTPGNHVRNKSGCPACYGKPKSDTGAFIKKAMRVHGNKYNYDKAHYTRALSKLIIICKTHGEFQQTPADHLSGKGCPLCAKRKITTEMFIGEAREIHGDKYDYSISTFTTTAERIAIRCAKHNLVFHQTYGNHIRGKQGCPVCGGRMRKSTAEFVESAIAAHGDRYSYEKSSYVACQKPVTITCKTHGDFEQYPDNHIRGKQGCPSCAHGAASKAQIELVNFLSEFTEVLTEYRFDETLRRIDIFLPKFNIGVEYHGNYWHSTACIKDKLKDYKKHTDAAKNDIRLIHIYEDEWAFRSEIVKRSLLTAIGASSRIGARKCKLTLVEESNACTFYWDNHMQGAPNASVHIGLEHKGVLVACMSFGVWRSNRTNTDPRHWELMRYAATCTVVGGASRLLKTFIGMELSDSITSYSDNRLFSGAMYEKLGFNKVHITKPDYTYTNGRVEFGRQHKAKFQKKHLVKMFLGCDVENKTELEICTENGLFRIYDCGKTRWDLNLTDRSCRARSGP